MAHLDALCALVAAALQIVWARTDCWTTSILGGLSWASSWLVVVTGPNQSGKSLKQVGILCVLVQTGSFVPAAACRLSLVDGLFTRIHCEYWRRRCAELAVHVLARLLFRRSTRRSLGTKFKDGVTLMPEPPKVLIATHLHELFQWDLLADMRHMHLSYNNLWIYTVGSN